MLAHLWELLFAFTLLGISWCFGKKCTCGGGVPPVNCTIFSDDFDRSDSTNLGSNWTETSGDSTIDSGTLKFTTTNAKATCNTNSPAADRVLNVKAAASTANNIGYVYVDTWKIEIRFSTTAGRVRIINPSGSSVASSPTNLNIALNTLLQVRVCYGDGVLRADISTVTNSCISYPASISGLSNGLGTGGTVSGSVWFDDFELKLRDDDCECAIGPCNYDSTCSACIDGIYPQNYTLIYSGIANMGSNTCCTNLNGAYIVPMLGTGCAGEIDLRLNGSAYTSCRGSTLFSCVCDTENPSSHGDYCVVGLQLSNFSFPKYTTIMGPPSNSCSRWNVAYDFTDETILPCPETSALSFGGGSSSHPTCDFSSATVSVIPGP